jgi:hypothetical protein
MSRSIVLVFIALVSSSVFSQGDPAVSSLPGPASGAPLPTKITGSWDHNGWGGNVEVYSIDSPAKTARTSLGKGGDSCGFHNALGIIKQWDGKTLHVEIPKPPGCRFGPIVFRFEKSGDRWEGVVENDARTVQATARGS